MGNSRIHREPRIQTRRPGPNSTTSITVPSAARPTTRRGERSQKPCTEEQASSNGNGSRAISPRQRAEKVSAASTQPRQPRSPWMSIPANLLLGVVR